MKNDFPKNNIKKQLEWEMCYKGEELLETNPGNYVNRSFWDSSYSGYDENGYEISLEKTARIVTRAYNGGDFVIFPKFSTYTRISSMSKGLHNKMNDNDFHDSIIKIIERINKYEKPSKI